MKYIVPDKHKHKLIERNNGSTENSFISLLFFSFLRFSEVLYPGVLAYKGSINVQLILLELFKQKRVKSFLKRLADVAIPDMWDAVSQIINNSQEGNSKQSSHN